MFAKAVLAVVGSGMLLSPAAAQAPAVSNEEAVANARVVAAYLFNIAKFVSWPDESDTIVLCVHGNSNLESTVSALEGRVLGDGHTLSVHIGYESPVGCHIAYVDASAGLSAVDPSEVDGWSPRTLTISNDARALQRGYAMELRVVKKRMGLKVNSALLQLSNYSVSSKLLRLAQRT